MSAHETFFRQMLADVDEPTAPFGLLDVQGNGAGIERAHIKIEAELAQRMRANARRLGVSAASLCHLAWAQVLAKVSCRDDVVFGTVLFGRMQGGAGADRAMGLFVNTLPVRIRLGNQSAEAGVRSTHALLADLLRHEHASLALAQRCSAVAPPTPLFSALLNYRHNAASQKPAAEKAPDLQGIQILRSEERTNYPFTLSVDDLGIGFELTARAAPAIGPKRVCEYMRTALASLVQALEKEPDKPLCRLEVLPVAEQHQLLYGWNGSRTVFPGDKCIHQLVEEQVVRTPEATALVFEGAELSYAELNGRANQLAHYLRELGVKPDARVALCVERGFEMIVGLLAVLKAGGAYVPLDPIYPEERLRFMLEDSAPAVALTQTHLRHLFAAVSDRLPVIDLAYTASDWQQHPISNLDPGSLGLTSSHLAYVIYTSGSTGMPKGVMVQHRGLCNLALEQSQYFEVAAHSRVLQFASFSFDASASEIMMALCRGAALHLLRKEHCAPGDALIETIAANRITHLTLPPAVLNGLSDGVQLESIRVLIVAGESLPSPTAERWKKDRLLVNAYGPTETTVCATMHTVDGEESSHPPIGRPIANARVYILDRQGEPVPVGVAGELYVGGAGVTRGYLNRPALTAEKFVADPFSSEFGSRMYRTGDLGRWLPEGDIEFLGRNDFQVKVRGFRIELGEIEVRLTEYAGVREAVVIAREDTAGDKRLVAYYAPSEMEVAVGPEQLCVHLSATLPDYMVPNAFVALDSLPLTPNGKLDRKALPTPEADAYATRRYEAPQGEIESKLAQIWSEALKLDRIGRQDDFFKLGGHSLLSIYVLTRVRQTLGIDVAIRDLFDHPKLAELATFLRSAAQVELPAITRNERNGFLPLSFAQQRLWFLAQMGTQTSSAYHMPFGLRLKGHLDRTALGQALDRIVARHEVLRTTFMFVDGQPSQKIAAPEDQRFVLTEQDLRGRADVQIELERSMAQDASNPFDLAGGALIRAQLLRIADDEHALLLTMHHIISDGWSLGVLVKELSTLYGAFLRGEPDPLPALEIQYADYALWQRKWIEGEIVRQQGDYWKRSLAGAPTLLELPTDRPRPANQDYSGAAVELGLDEKLTSGLRELSKRHGTTLYMTLLAGWAVLLARLAGQQEVVIGSPSANRGRVEIESLIGLFINTLALRIDLSSSPTLVELLAQVKQQTIDAQQNQDIPFEQVVELAQPERSLSHSPLFQVMFQWQNAPGDPVDPPGLKLRPFGSPAYRVAKCDLTLNLQESGQCIVGGVEYAIALFDAATIERYLEYFRRLLEAMAADDSQPVDRLNMLNAAERRQLLYQWNDTQTAFQANKCTHELIEEQVTRTPKATAVVFEDSKLSYEEMNRRANQLAHYLRELGAGPDARIAICVERRFEMIVGLLAVLKAGGAYVPLDPAYPEERLRFMLDDSAPVALLTQASLRHLFAGVSERFPVLDLSAETSAWQQLPETNLDPGFLGLTSKHLAYVIYTSGSTGRPKGVMITHASLCNYLSWALQTYRQGNALVSSSVSFDATVTSLYTPLLCGETVRLLAEGEEVHSLYTELQANKNCGLVKISPSYLHVLGHRMLSEGLSSSVRVFVIGGEPLSRSTVRLWRRIQPKVPLVNEYGPTETTVGVCVYEIPFSKTPDNILIGQPIANARLYILDAYGEPVPVGIPGEVYIGGAGVARGYLKRPELTAEKFLPDPFAPVPGALMYKTGDRARRLPDGNIDFLGRNDFQVKIRGFRIELGEIESRLTEYPGVRHAVVLAREDTAGDKRLVAYYTSGTDALIDAQQLRIYLSKELPGYMVPAAYVPLKSLPVTSNGKLDRKSLPAPEADAYGMRAYEAPQGEVETKLVQIWAEVLNLERVGRHDNFFELGGHSLLALSLMERMQRSGLQVDVRALFAAPTPAALAAEQIQEIRL